MKVGGKHYRSLWADESQGVIHIIDQARLPHVFETATIGSAEANSIAHRDFARAHCDNYAILDEMLGVQRRKRTSHHNERLIVALPANNLQQMLNDVVLTKSGRDTENFGPLVKYLRGDVRNRLTQLHVAKAYAADHLFTEIARNV